MILEIDIIKVPGLFCPDTAFLDNPDTADDFKNDVRDQIEQLEPSWDPHFKLEYLKMSIHTLLGVCSKKFSIVLIVTWILLELSLTNSLIL